MDVLGITTEYKYKKLELGNYFFLHNMPLAILLAYIVEQ